MLRHLNRRPIRPHPLSRPLRGRYLATVPPTTSTPQTPQTPPTPETAQTPPTPTQKVSRWRSFLVSLGRVTLITVVVSGGTLFYFAQKDKHPGSQLPPDPSKKTVVVLGSGWAATSFIKNLDTSDYNVVVISPRNYFLFTPLLPSCAVGTVSFRSIIQPIRYLTRHKTRQVTVIEAEAQSVDPVSKIVTFEDNSAIKGEVASTSIGYDYLVYAVGAETQTFGIPGVKENACFMKELHDAEQMRETFMDCIETAGFPGQSDEEIDRLLHMVVVGGGPTGIELSGELHDFLVDDLKYWYPELAGRLKITLIEALPSVLPMFSKQLISYTESTFKEEKIEILTNTMVKEIKPNLVVVQKKDGAQVEIPFGLIVWAGGNKTRKVTTDLMAHFPDTQKNKRGLTIDEHLLLSGSSDIFALGDATSTAYAPTAQVASQQGAYLAKLFAQLASLDENGDALKKAKADPNADPAEVKRLEEKVARADRLRPFHYSHQGSLAYVGSDKAIADLPFMKGNLSLGGVMTFLFWRSVYISELFSMRNRTLVMLDWLKTKLFGRDVSRE